MTSFETLYILHQINVISKITQSANHITHQKSHQIVTQMWSILSKHL